MFSLKILIYLWLIKQSKMVKKNCWYCLQCFSSQKVFQYHTKYSLANNRTKSVLLPEEGACINFQNFKRLTKA